MISELGLEEKPVEILDIKRMKVRASAFSQSVKQ